MSVLQHGLSRVLLVALALLLALGWLLGGSAEGWETERWLALPALLLIVGCTWRIALLPPAPAGGLRDAWLPPCLFLALPLLQLLPLPPSLWGRLPGHDALLAELALAGVAPAWRPLSVNPAGTELLLLSLLLPVAVFLAARLLHGPQLRLLVWGLLLFAAGNAVLGLLQLRDGRQSELYLYEISNRDSAVGVFANRNHLGSLLALCVPVATGLLADRLRHLAAVPASRDLRVWVLTGLLVLLGVGVTTTQSRAGLLLLMLAALASGAVLWRSAAPPGPAREPGPQRYLQLAGGLGLLLALQYTLFAALRRMQALDPFEDGRWQYALHILRAGAPNRGMGWGLGSFQDVYDEVGEVVADAESYINHAHNDFLELWLEAGVLAVVLVVLSCWYLARLTRRAWYAQRLALAQPPAQRHHHHGLQLGAACSLWLLVVHSAFDYPLRTTTLACTAALLLAVLMGSLRDVTTLPRPGDKPA